MKCDELEPIEFEDDFINGNVVQYYDKHDVDEAIDEMKEKLRLAEMAKDDAESANTEYREDINKLKSENERLVKCCKEYDSRQHIDEHIKFNGAKQLRATKRAMWLARANYCHNFRIDWYISRHPSSKMSQSTMENTLIIAEMNCRNKAKEYE